MCKNNGTASTRLEEMTKPELTEIRIILSTMRKTYFYPEPVVGTLDSKLLTDLNKMINDVDLNKKIIELREKNYELFEPKEPK